MLDPLLVPLPESIVGERLRLKVLRAQHAQSLFDAAKESYEGLNQWYNGVLTKSDLTLAQTQVFIENCLADFYKRDFIQYGIFDLKDRLIGIGVIHHLDWTVPKGRIGYWVRASEQKKGYATEISNILTRFSFDKLSMKRLEIRTATENKGSAVIPQRLNYKHVALFEKNKTGNNGQIWDLDIWVRFDLEDLPNVKITYQS